MKVLVACEFTGVVRRAFRALGHDAYSCDLRASLDGSNFHIRDDVRKVLKMERWEMLMVAHPPCTRLCNSGVRWLKQPPTKLTAEHYSPAEIAAYAQMSVAERLEFMWMKLDEGAALFSDLWNAYPERICVENPVMHHYAKERITNYKEFAQSVQPWQFGHGEIKRTCFWLKNLPLLEPTNIVKGRVARVHHATPGPERWIERSKFFEGMAEAMALQWGGDVRGEDERLAA